MMAFVNEYIPEADFEKYDLRRVCGEHNFAQKGHMYSRSWSIDRDHDAFLIPVWFHHESDFIGWAFYWKTTWLFFEVTGTGGGVNSDGSCWHRYKA